MTPEEIKVEVARIVEATAANIETQLTFVTTTLALVEDGTDLTDVRRCVAEAMPRVSMIRTLAPKLANGGRLSAPAAAGALVK